MNRYFFKTYILFSLSGILLVSFAGVFFYLQSQPKKDIYRDHFLQRTSIVNCAFFNENYASRFFLTNAPLSHKPYNTDLFEISYGLNGWR
ncbi:MAG: hypothetical protein GXO11_05465 [Epsilonproteobacteria bacterium]|nr:hypothetical protein [Campylobacterota bacterium]